MPDMVETERFFPVKGETPMCSEIRVCMCKFYILLCLV